MMQRLRVVVGAGMFVLLTAVPGTASAESRQSNRAVPVFFNLPEPSTANKGTTRFDWNYTFLRGDHHDRVFDAGQTLIRHRLNRRKTHLVAWRLKYGLTDRLQPEAEVVYKAYRQHTHGDGNTHDRNDDGDFERLFAGASYQAVRESERLPDVRLRGGVLMPRRAENENIGQESGFELLAAAGKHLGGWGIVGDVAFAMTFDNHDQPVDPLTGFGPISKGHDLRRLSYGFGCMHPLTSHWQANLELDGTLYDAIQLNERIHKSDLTLTPGLVFRKAFSRWEGWIGLGIPIGVIRRSESLTHNTDHIGVAIRTGAVF